MIFDLIRNRRSIFPAQYNNQAIEKETIQRILEAANWAPTHKKTEPWRFKVMQGEAQAKLGIFLAEKYQEIEEKPKEFKIKKLTENPKRAGAIIAICMQRDLDERIPEWEEIASVAMAVQNMWLCCTSMNIGCYWSSPGLIRFMDAFFDLNQGEKCLGFFYMGHYDEVVPPSSRTSIEAKTTWLD